jgi:four helix bundle protein
MSGYNEMERVLLDDSRDIIKQALGLVNSVKKMSYMLPDEDIYRIRERLMITVESVPQKIENGLVQGKKIEQRRNLIKANSALNELRNYLNLVNELRYFNTNTMIKQIDKVSQYLSAKNPFL